MADRRYRDKKEKASESNCGCGCNNNGNVNEKTCGNDCGCECNAQETEDVNANEPQTEVIRSSGAEKELAEIKDKFLRLAADFENFKKRSRAEKEAIYSNAVSDTVLVILPILDSVEYALKVETNDEPFKQGVVKIVSQAEKCFSDLNIVNIGKAGEIFNPELHNAVAHVEDESLEAGVIAEVLQNGYMLRDKVIRHALVKVAN